MRKVRSEGSGFWKIAACIMIFAGTFFMTAGRALSYEIEGLSGFEIDSKQQGYRYLGIGLEQSLSSDLKILGRILSSALRYEFDSGSETLSAHSFSVIPSVGIRYHRGPMTMGLYIGEDFRRTKRETIFSGHETEYDNGISIQGELYSPFAKIHSLGLIASYSQPDRSIWNRLRLQRQITNLDFSQPAFFYIGAEVIGSGNTDFRAFQAGGLIGVVYRPINLSLTLKGGYKNTSTHKNIGYGGMELYLKF